MLLSYYYYNFCNFSFFGGSYILLLLCFSKTARYLDVASLTSLLLPFVCFCPAIQSWLFCFDQWIMTTIKMLQPVAKKNRQQILHTTEHISLSLIFDILSTHLVSCYTTLCMCNCICSDFVYIIITTKRGYIASWPEASRVGAASRSVTLGNSL